MEKILPLANHAEIAVVDDRDIDVQLLLHAGGELVKRHLETAITDDGPDFEIRPADFGANR